MQLARTLALAALAPLAAALLSKAPVPATVAAFIQVGNPTYWPDMKRCIQVVAQADVQAVDLYLSFLEPHDEIVAEARAIPGLRNVTGLVVENRGADIGQFLQQLQALPAGVSYTATLKLHTKTFDGWRLPAIESLCASPAQVTSHVQSFISEPNLGILGPDFLTRAYTDPGASMLFNRREVPAMQAAWRALEPNQPLVPKQAWRIVAGSMYWARQSAVLEDPALRLYLPQLLAAIPPGAYQKGSCCQFAHGLERIMPTRSSCRGFAVRGVPQNPGAASMRVRSRAEIIRILREGMMYP